MTNAASRSVEADQSEKAIEKLLVQHQGGCRVEFTLRALSGDGSMRRFWRIERADGESSIAVAPPVDGGEKERAEAMASAKIGAHLRQAKIAVPEIYGFDEGQHLLIYEDLGDEHLQTLIVGLDLNSEKDADVARDYYRKTICQLLAMQVEGARGFRQEWCWDTPRYDRDLMLERESGYFLRAFWQDLLKQDVPFGLVDEFEHLADEVSTIPSEYFLHRDFQSRNVMVKGGAARIIDYQGGRLGPLGYDLASLLIDPYVALPSWFQDELFDYYHDQLRSRMTIPKNEFRRQYLLLATQRNLQIIGAFAFLSAVRGKVFFARYIKPAVRSLECLIAEQKTVYASDRFVILEQLVQRAREILEQNEPVTQVE